MVRQAEMLFWNSLTSLVSALRSLKFSNYILLKFSGLWSFASQDSTLMTSISFEYGFSQFLSCSCWSGCIHGSWILSNYPFIQNSTWPYFEAKEKQFQLVPVLLFLCYESRRRHLTRRVEIYLMVQHFYWGTDIELPGFDYWWMKCHKTNYNSSIQIWVSLFFFLFFPFSSFCFESPSWSFESCQIKVVQLFFCLNLPTGKIDTQNIQR